MVIATTIAVVQNVYVCYTLEGSKLILNIHSLLPHCRLAMAEINTDGTESLCLQITIDRTQYVCPALINIRK